MRRKKSDPMMESDVKRESSIPVQSRISVIDLANMCKYWEEIENVQMDSMSKLVNWSVSALCDLLYNNEKIPGGIDNVADANKYLVNKGLYQKSLNNRTKRKINNAMTLESLRNQGIDPRGHIPTQHNMVNNIHSVKPYNGEVSNREVEAAKKLIARARANKEKMNNYDPIQAAKDSGMKVVGNNEGGIKEGMSNEELNAYDVERERKIREMENAPVDVSMFNVVKE